MLKFAPRNFLHGYPTATSGFRRTSNKCCQNGRCEIRVAAESNIARSALILLHMDFNRDSFPFHRNWYNAISLLDDKSRLELYDAVMRKAFFNEPPQLEGNTNVAMSFIEPQLEQDTDKWLDIREKRKKSGSMGGRPKANESKQNQMVSEKTNCFSPVVNNNNILINNIESKEEDKEKKDINMSFMEKKPKKFVKPTVEEIRAYCIEKGYTFDPEAFFAFYESKGWVVGKSPMKSWKAACTTWYKSNKQNNNNYGRETITDKIKRTAEEADLFSQQLKDRIGKQAELDYGNNSEVW